MKRIRPFDLMATRGDEGFAVNRNSPSGLCDLVGWSANGGNVGWYRRLIMTKPTMNHKVVVNNIHLTSFWHSHYDPPK